jgi:DNA-directed RNA polymerase subunit F
MKVVSTAPTSAARVKELLAKRAEAGEELGYEQANALEHATALGEELEAKKVAALAAKLGKEFPALGEEAAMKLAEIQPSSPELVRAILLYSKVELSEEEIKKVLDAIKG